MSREVRHDGAGALQVRFPFDRELVERIKQLPHRRWIAAERYWSVPEHDVVPLVELLRPLEFRFDATTIAIYRQLGGRLDLEEPSAPPPPRTGRLFDEPPADAAEEEREGRPADADGDRSAGNGAWSVSALNREVQAALAAAFPRSIWLVGEISSFDRNAHKRVVTFQFDERDAAGRVVSSVAASLFPDERAAIDLALERAGDPFRLGDEVTVRVRARVELYVPWGSYRVVVEELDVSFTLGEAARRREEIVRRLTAAGLLGRNVALALPPLPLAVGLVTSIGSDAYNDVLRTLQESGWAFRVTVHGARVQGQATEASVLNALDWFRARAACFDLVLICRGGGSRTDLAWFDSEPLGRAVALFPLPVVVGIGHEQDHSVLDAVGRRAKTPTAAAALVVDAVRAGLEAVLRSGAGILDRAARQIAAEGRHGTERARRLAAAARGLVERERIRLDHRTARTGRAARASCNAARERARRVARDLPRAAAVELARQRALVEGVRRAVVQGTRRDVVAAERRLADAVRALGTRAARAIAGEAERHEQRARRLHLVDPRRVLERGYAILRGGAGRVVTDSDAAPAGTMVDAELRRGTLRLRSEGAPHRDGR
jgi:exodeoxyribonuclease VII large subunit